MVVNSPLLGQDRTYLKDTLQTPLATVTIVSVVVKNFTYNIGYFEKCFISVDFDQPLNKQAHHRQLLMVLL